MGIDVLQLEATPACAWSAREIQVTATTNYTEHVERGSGCD